MTIEAGDRLLLTYDPRYVDDGTVAVTVTDVTCGGDLRVRRDDGFTYEVTSHELERLLVKVTPEPAGLGEIIRLVADRHTPQRATIRRVYPHERPAPRVWLYEVRPESYDQAGHPCQHDPHATVRVTHDEIRRYKEQPA